MKSGLEGRNNNKTAVYDWVDKGVSMKSGLEGRNNAGGLLFEEVAGLVSMKSGLEGRNNCGRLGDLVLIQVGLNEVRPRRPEQYP